MSSGGLGIQSAFASKVVPVLGPSVEELFVKSMRNTIDGKRSQFSMSAPSLLILQPGNWRFAPDYIQYLIEKRIWPNAKYAWLTGIGILKPRRTFNKGDAPTNLTVTWNTQPTEPRTEALEALIERNAWFSKGLHIESPSDA